MYKHFSLLHSNKYHDEYIKKCPWQLKSRLFIFAETPIISTWYVLPKYGSANYANILRMADNPWTFKNIEKTWSHICYLIRLFKRKNSIYGGIFLYWLHFTHVLNKKRQICGFQKTTFVELALNYWAKIS